MHTSHRVSQEGVRVPRGASRRAFWSAVLDCLVHNPRALKISASFAALYAPWPLSRSLGERLDRQIDDAAAEAAEAPAPPAGTALRA